MKTPSLSFLLSLFTCILGTQTLPAAEEPQALYVHCFLPTSEKPPTRADTVRVQLGKKVEAKPPQTRGTVTALVQKRGEKWHVELSGNYGAYTGFYEGEAALEKPVKALSYFFSGGASTVCFLLSTNPDFEKAVPKDYNAYEIDPADRKYLPAATRPGGERPSPR